MEEKVYASITPELLLNDGWVKSEEEHSIYPYSKVLENINPLNDSEDSDIKLVLHGMYNTWTFAVLLPDGGMLNFVANSMEELKGFEEKISFYDPPF